MSEDRYWMKKPCGLCPFARPPGMLGLHPSRATDFAYTAQNPYTDFVCHKTGDVDDDDPEGGSSIVRGDQSYTCCGFLSLQVSENGRGPDGFKPHPDAFDCADSMIEHHIEAWEAQRGEAWRYEDDEDAA